MFNFSYHFCDHVAYLQKLGKFIGAAVTNNILWLPPKIGDGYIKAVLLANGLQVLINECVIIQDIRIHREGSDGADYTLRFDEVRNMKALTLKIGETILEEDHQVYSGAFLTNSLSTLEYTTTAGTENRCVNIHFTEKWLNSYSGVKSTDSFLTKYFGLKTSAFNIEVLNIEYRELMEEIFTLNEDHPLYKTVLQNRVMLLLEKFLRNLYNKMSDPQEELRLDEGEIKRMMMIESVLVSNLSIAPPPLSELARIAMMSETKLKTVFKKIYRLNPYEYYQKNRMLKARQLLNKKALSVKEIGRQMGFQNLSNFTIAYKKEFNMLPSNV